MTSTEATPRTDVGRERLAAAVESLVNSDQWTAWLESRARFHGYSFGNTMLIGFQRPDATQVAGYKAWQSLGRQVRKGEKGIAILAPMVRRVKDAETGEQSEVLDDSGRRIVRFRTVYVFDVAQTEGDELPEAPIALPVGGRPEDYMRLQDLAESEQLSVSVDDLSAGTNGQLDRGAWAITLGTHLFRTGSPAARIKTLAHELGHWFDLGPGATIYDRHEAEIVAEAVAFIVGHRLGLDTSSYSACYVASWAGGDAQKLHTLAERIDKAARPILDVLA
jgi:N-terminal domain of anti-restriction factor ArdC